MASMACSIWAESVVSVRTANASVGSVGTVTGGTVVALIALTLG